MFSFDELGELQLKCRRLQLSESQIPSSRSDTNFIHNVGNINGIGKKFHVQKNNNNKNMICFN